jgi:branched-chain amino acid transport system permease protein
VIRGRVLALHLAVLAVLLGLQFVLPPFHHGMLARIMVLAAYGLGYNLLLGYTGLMSLGHAMFFGAGMYATGLAVYYRGAGSAEALALGLAAAVVLAAGIGLITLRTSGVAFLIVTMMFAQVFFLTSLYLNAITGGDQGLVLTGRLAPIRLGAWELPLAHPAVKYNLALALLAVCLWLTLWITRSPAGRVLIAIRENEDRTRMLGYNVFSYKLLALVLSGAISGLAGSVWTLLFSYVGSSFAGILYSIYPLLWTLLGGAGTALGPLVGAGLMTYIVDVASGLTDSYLLVVGAGLILCILWLPSGVMGGLRRRWWPWLP